MTAIWQLNLLNWRLINEKCQDQNIKCGYSIVAIVHYASPLITSSGEEFVSVW